MCTPPTRRESIFSRWDATDEDMQHRIFNEFKMNHKGCYTQKDLLNFLEKKLFEKKNPGKRETYPHEIIFSQKCAQNYS